MLRYVDDRCGPFEGPGGYFLGGDVEGVGGGIVQVRLPVKLRVMVVGNQVCILIDTG